MNYYEILKVSKDAKEDEIKASYKSLVKKYHPDLYVGDKNFAEQKIKEINEAYDVLSDPERKKEYDEYLNPPLQPQGTQYYQAGYQYNSSAYSHYNGTTNQSQSTQETEAWSLTKWITVKFNKLESKQQLRIFILVLVFILSIFLIDLIQMKSYLETGQSPFLKTKPNSNNATQNTFVKDDYYNNPKNYYPNENDYDNYNYKEDFDIDAYLDEFFEQYEQYKDEFYQEYNINPEDIFPDEGNATI